MIKMHHEYPKYPKTLENNQNAPKTTTKHKETFKMTQIPLNPQNKQNTLETFETKPKNTRFFDFVGILVSF